MRVDTSTTSVFDMSTPTTASGFASDGWLRSAESGELTKRVGRMLYDNMTASEERMSHRFFGGPAASDKSRKFLAVLLRKSTNAELAADLRAYFNTLHGGGDHITQADVSCAIRLLKGE